MGKLDGHFPPLLEDRVVESKQHAQLRMHVSANRKKAKLLQAVPDFLN